MAGTVSPRVVAVSTIDHEVENFRAVPLGARRAVIRLDTSLHGLCLAENRTQARPVDDQAAGWRTQAVQMEDLMAGGDRQGAPSSAALIGTASAGNPKRCLDHAGRGRWLELPKRIAALGRGACLKDGSSDVQYWSAAAAIASTWPRPVAESQIIGDATRSPSRTLRSCNHRPQDPEIDEEAGDVALQVGLTLAHNLLPPLADCPRGRRPRSALPMHAPRRLQQPSVVTLNQDQSRTEKTEV